MNWNANDTTQLVRAALIDRQGSDAVAKIFNTSAEECGRRLIELADMTVEELGRIIPPDCILAVHKWAASKESARLHEHIELAPDEEIPPAEELAVAPEPITAGPAQVVRVIEEASAKVAGRGAVCCSFCCGAKVTIYKDCHFSQTIIVQTGNEPVADAVMT